MKLIKPDSTGQSLMEVLIVLAVAIVVMTALVMVILTGLKNAQFAQNQSKATKFAQEGLEKVRTIRDRDGLVDFIYDAGGETMYFSDLWYIYNGMSAKCSPNPCYLKLGLDLSLSGTYAASSSEDLGDGLTREIMFTDTASTSAVEKQVTVRVFWEDSAGTHESNLQTVLTKR